uniref:Methyltransferase domain-containing protein n=1 Tax=Pyrodinium bahamense TaxID=73915 RepID=A0A7S0FRW8_9DINO
MESRPFSELEPGRAARGLPSLWWNADGEENSVFCSDAQAATASQVISPQAAVQRTVAYYARRAGDFCRCAFGPSAKAAADARARFLRQLQAAWPVEPRLRILDAGCGPGRDLAAFCQLGHEAEGLEPCEQLAEVARARSGAPVHGTDFLGVRGGELGCYGEAPSSEGHFHGVFCLASLLHVPRRELPGVLRTLCSMTRVGGVMLATLPLATSQREDTDCMGSDGRWCNRMAPRTYLAALRDAGWEVLEATALSIYSSSSTVAVCRRPAAGVAARMAHRALRLAEPRASLLEGGISSSRASLCHGSYSPGDLPCAQVQTRGRVLLDGCVWGC